MTHRALRHGASRARGFTLIELLVTVSVSVVLLAVVVPSFANIFFSYRLTNFTNTFVSSVQLARSEAIKRNGSVTLCRSSDGAACATSGGWQQGWIVRAGTDVLLKQPALITGYLLTGDSYSVNFDALGNGTGTANLTLCRAQPKVGDQERSIKINAVGRISVTTTRLGTCS